MEVRQYQRRVVRTYENLAQACAWAAENIVVLSERAMSDRGCFTLVLAGGSTPAMLYDNLAQASVASRIDWSMIDVFFGDERCVPPSHQDSNYRMAAERLLSKVPIPQNRIFRMPGELPPDQGSLNYEETVRQYCKKYGRLNGEGKPIFDLVLLGMGTDGHTASLFPGSPALQETSRWVVAAPPPKTMKPSVPRLTMTLPVLNSADNLWMLIAGKEKRVLADQIMGQKPVARNYPAARLAPAGLLSWLIAEK